MTAQTTDNKAAELAKELEALTPGGAPPVAPTASSKTSHPVPPPASDEDDEGDEETPAEPAKRRVKRKSAPSTQSKGISKTSPFAKILPGAERVIIQFRMDDGSLAHIGEYRAEDIETAGGINPFIQQYHVRKYGPGDYYLTYKDPSGKEFDGGKVTIPKPIDHSADPSEMWKKVVEEQAKIQEQADRKAREQYEQLQKAQEPMMKMQEAMITALASGKGKEEGGGNPMMLMLMMQMQQQQQAAMQQMLLASQQPRESKSEAAIMALLEKLADKMNEPPPLPPPAPAPASAEPNMLAEAFKAFSESQRAMLEIMRPSAPSKDPAETALTLMQAIGGGEKLGLSEMIGALKELKGTVSPTDEGHGDFSKYLNDLIKLEHFFQIRQGRQSGGGEGFFDFLRELVDKLPDTAGSIADIMDRVRAKDGSQAPKRSKERLGAGRRSQQRVSNGANGANGASQAPMALPDGFTDHAVAIRDAKDDAEIIQGVLSALFFLNSHDGWKAIPEKILALVEQGEIDEAVEVVIGFGQGLEKMGIIDEARVEDIRRCFTDHIEDILEGLGYEFVDDGAPGKPDLRVVRGGKSDGPTKTAEAKPPEDGSDEDDGETEDGESDGDEDDGDEDDG